MSTKQTTEQPARKAPDKSPENDMSKAIDLMRSARAKWIRQGDEERAGRVFDLIATAKTAMGKAGE